MKRELRSTEDGSHTLFVPGLDEPYHSIHGALQESKHVFIETGFRAIRKMSVRILEIGLGTGLNVLLTLCASLEPKKPVYYHAVEKYPLLPDEYRQLNFEKMNAGIPKGSLVRLHKAPWNTGFDLADHFTVFKERSDIRTMHPSGPFDLVYFDAFAPDKQPEIWSPEVFDKIADMLAPGAVLVTYSSRGSVRRTLVSCGFEVKKVPGPPGKREMIRAIRI